LICLGIFAVKVPRLKSRSPVVFLGTVIRVLNKVKGGGVAGFAADPCRPFTVL
jgi:hypothetical protein